MKKEYFKNPSVSSALLVNDVSQLNEVKVQSSFTPATLSELESFFNTTSAPLSLGGGRFSMGKQSAQEETVFVDLRNLNKVLHFSPELKEITVEPGVRWCEIQSLIDPYNLSVKIMQTYANFTVGGSLSVNCHGRYVGQGPLILSVKEIKVLTSLGIKKASPAENAELFFGSIGCYGALGIIVEATLKLDLNHKIKRTNKVMPVMEYHKYFQSQVANHPLAVFHNADLHPPFYNTLNAVTWHQTCQKVKSERLASPGKGQAFYRFFFWLLSETTFGQYLRRSFLEKIYYAFPKVSWKNNEAGYDVAELEPKSRKEKTYILQEYFIPVKNFDSFVSKLREILLRHKVNVINISIRHAHADSGSYLAWAKEEVYAFVLYYKQETSAKSQEQVAVWTRELISAALSENGSYYLPYQVHATKEQFLKAYPQASKLLNLKQKYDPKNRLKNSLWAKCQE